MFGMGGMGGAWGVGLGNVTGASLTSAGPYALDKKSKESAEPRQPDGSSPSPPEENGPRSATPPEGTASSPAPSPSASSTEPSGTFPSALESVLSAIDTPSAPATPSPSANEVGTPPRATDEQA